MEREAVITWSRVGKTLNKFKYPALVLLLGAALLLWPVSNKQEKPAEEQSEQVEAVFPSVEEQMEAILSCIDGAGQVRVMLTRLTDDETVYQSDTSNDLSADGTQHTESSTVMAGMSGGGESPLVRTKVYGKYQGALIVCQGADRAAVRLELVNAVADLTGLSTDRITVIKMKS